MMGLERGLRAVVVVVVMLRMRGGKEGGVL